MTYRIEGLSPTLFRPLFALDDAALAARSIERSIAAESSGTPCRVSLVDAEAGDEVLLLSHAHLEAASPYATRGPIFVRRRAVERDAAVFVDAIPDMLARRLVSVRAYDARASMIDAEVVDGTALDALVVDWLGRTTVDWIDVHTARRGCFMARVRRTD